MKKEYSSALKIGIALIVFLVICLVAFNYFYSDKRSPGGGGTVTSFEECVAVGNLVMESYPRQCRDNGQTFIEDIGNELGKTDLIHIFEPRPNILISSPLTIRGEARGTWFFEASFPVRLLDENGTEIAVAPAQAQGEWMTEEFVPFEVTLHFSPPMTTGGTLILEKDNPSGLPEHADELRVPVWFALTESTPGRKDDDTGESVTRDGCVVSGCSSQVCADHEVITTCEFRPEYACYRTATCRKQADGKCGWDQTEQIRVCLNQNSQDTQAGTEVKAIY